MGRINKLPSSSDIDLRVWARGVSDTFNNYIQTLEVPVSKSGIIANYVHGKHPAKRMVAGDSGYFGFIVPNSLSAFKEATIRFIANTTGTVNYTVNLAYGGVGQGHAATTQTASVIGASVTDGLISEFDISSFFIHPLGDQDLNDQIGCELVVNALTTTVSLDVLSLYIKYI